MKRRQGFTETDSKHIFIDEYQDSNVIQEALIDLIKRHDNLFSGRRISNRAYTSSGWQNRR